MGTGGDTVQRCEILGAGSDLPANIAHPISRTTVGLGLCLGPNRAAPVTRVAYSERCDDGRVGSGRRYHCRSHSRVIYVRGWPIAVLGVVGLIGGFGYTAPPLQYKFRALGIPLVFLLMGPLMVGGAYYVITGTFDVRALIVSIPVGLLVAAILLERNTDETLWMILCSRPGCRPLMHCSR